MTLPFTPETFLSLFAQYNAAIWPLQIAAAAAGLVVFGAAIQPFRGSDRLAAGLLAAMWLWTGIGWHWQFFATISFFAPAFALLFVAQGLLLAWTGVVRGRLAFRLRPGAAGFAAMGLMVWAFLVYPLTGWLAGHAWPAAPVFGVAPSPTTIFTMGALLALAGRTPGHLVVLPVLWSVIGGMAALLLAMPEDIALPVAGLGGAALIAWRNRRSRAAAA